MARRRDSGLSKALDDTKAGQGRNWNEPFDAQMSACLSWGPKRARLGSSLSVANAKQLIAQYLSAAKKRGLAVVVGELVKNGLRFWRYVQAQPAATP